MGSEAGSSGSGGADTGRMEQIGVMKEERIARQLVSLALLLMSLLLLVALLSHSPLDPSPFHVSSARDQPHNLIGPLGAIVSGLLLDLIGLSALLTPVIGLLLVWYRLRGVTISHPRLLVGGWLVVTVATSGLLNLIRSDIELRGGVVSCGGLLGRASDELLLAIAGPVGRLLVLLFLGVIGIVMVSGMALDGAFSRGWDRAREWLDDVGERRRSRKRQKGRLQAQRKAIEHQITSMRASDTEPVGPITVKEIPGKGKFRVRRKVVERSLPEPAAEEAPAAAQTPSARARGRSPRSSKKSVEPAAKDSVLQEEFDFVADLETYHMPSVSFLQPSTEDVQLDHQSLLKIGETLTNKCQEFKVSGSVVNIRTGPVITTYEFKLDSGVKISAVQNLGDDLALALETESVRIERIPGRATVGIEVPNAERQIIRLRELVDTEQFRSSRSLLNLALGVDIHGNPFFADLQKMPHLLVGGFTGSGKSVGINAMLLSILYRARPDQVRFILVDPKMVELGVYKDIPHLLTPIINDPKKAANALGWAVSEMENRYRRLATWGVRDLESYNKAVEDPERVARMRESGDLSEGEAPERLPYIVVIIDELADLMMTSSRAVEEAIARLAQKARAVGIHLICATQRPSVDILTGVIKANFPCRIAYKVRSKFDSRTILDAIGAEHLLGWGDMLYLPQGTSNVLRLHGSLVDEKEIATVVRFIKRSGKPDYQREVLSHPPLGDNGKKGGGGGAAGAADDESEADDPVYDEARRLVVESRKASASFIQRRLRVGYNRAARLIELMESEGLVGPSQGAKAREVLVPPEYFDEVDATHRLNGEEEEDGNGDH